MATLLRRRIAAIITCLALAAGLFGYMQRNAAEAVHEAGQVGFDLYPVGLGLGPRKDCDDFASQAEAQRFFDTHGSPEKDRHGLDPDGDLIACERLAP